MLFSELRLCMAIHRAQLGGNDITSNAKRVEMAMDVFSEYVLLFKDSRFPYSIDEIDRLRLALRKSVASRVKVDVALTHGATCFFTGRGKGPCCDEVECGHLIPNCQGGALSVENCVIECRSHNNQRRERTIEQYLADTSLNTVQEAS